MKDVVWGSRFTAFALVGSFALVAAYSLMLLPYGVPWLALGGVGVALLAALWVGHSSPRSIALVLEDIEAEPVPALAPKPRHAGPPIWGHIVWLSLVPVFS